MISLSSHGYRAPGMRMLVIAWLCVIFGYAAVRSWHLLFPVGMVAIPPNPDCNLRAGPCITRMSGGASVSFGIQPRSIPAIEPLQLSVELHGIEAESVSVDFSGVGMVMGLNQAKLKEQAPGFYTGQVSLPVCVRAAMEWEARVSVETRGGIHAAHYRFILVKPGAASN